MNKPAKHVALICNPTIENGKALRVSDEVVQLLKAKDIAYTIFTQAWPDVWEGFTDAWIFGGDGTLNFFINNYPDTRIPISIFRGGSGNDFHWMLYGDLSTKDQFEQILKGGTTMVDAGICNGQLFLNGVGIGFDGSIVKDLVGRKKLAGTASYMLSILKNIVAFRETQCNIRMNGENFDEECFMISIANTKRYGGGFMVAPHASYSDAKLDLNLVGRIAPLTRMKYLPVIEKGEHIKLPFVRYVQTDSIIINASDDMPAHIDGEYVSTSLFEIACLPKKFLFSL
jgi:YegS/Rv2252/BmrU family lipid kinase